MAQHTTKQICPHCMGWLHDIKDPKLKKEGWVRCGTCGFSRKNDIQKDDKEYINKNK